MVSDWKEIKLDSLVDFTPKRTIKKGTLAPFVSMADITENSKYISEFFEKEYKGGGSRFKNGDTLFARITPCLQNGKCSRVTGLKDDSIAHGSTEFIVMAAKNPEFDSEFIYYLARTPHFRAYAESRMIGSTGRQRVAWQDLADYEFIVPNEPQRKLIGEVLSKFDEKIELNRRMNETLEAMAQALFKSWFVDFDPVIDNALLAGKSIPEPLKERAEMRQAQLDSGKANINSEINDLFPSEFEFTEELGWTPKGWSVCNFKNIVEKYIDNRGKTPPLSESGIPLIEVKHISDNSLKPSLDTSKYVDRETYNTWFRAHLETDDIIISTVGTIGRICIVSEGDEFCIAQNLLGFRFDKEAALPSFMYYQMDSHVFKHDVDARLVTTVQASIKRKDLETIPLLLPDMQIQEAFNKTVAPLMEKQNLNSNINLSLANLRDTLLPKLMSGELRIADAEKLVADI